ncbi:exported hypothetical protein [Tenacibaculum aestuarii]
MLRPIKAGGKILSKMKFRKIVLFSVLILLIIFVTVKGIVLDGDLTKFDHVLLLIIFLFLILKEKVYKLLKIQ